MTIKQPKILTISTFPVWPNGAAAPNIFIYGLDEESKIWHWDYTDGEWKPNWMGEKERAERIAAAKQAEISARQQAQGLNRKARRASAKGRK